MKLLFGLSFMLITAVNTHARCLFENKTAYTVDRKADFTRDDPSKITGADILLINQHFTNSGYLEVPFSFEALSAMDGVENPALLYLTSKKTKKKYVFAYSFPGENKNGTYYDLKTMEVVAEFSDVEIISCTVKE